VLGTPKDEHALGATVLGFAGVITLTVATMQEVLRQFPQVRNLW
jgi:hypothetical protein